MAARAMLLGAYIKSNIIVHRRYEKNRQRSQWSCALCNDIFSPERALIPKLIWCSSNALLKSLSISSHVSPCSLTPPFAECFSLEETLLCRESVELMHTTLSFSSQVASLPECPPHHTGTTLHWDERPTRVAAQICFSVISLFNPTTKPGLVSARAPLISHLSVSVLNQRPYGALRCVWSRRPFWRLCWICRSI